LPQDLKTGLPLWLEQLGDGSQDYLSVRTGLSKLDRQTAGLSGLVVLGGTGIEYTADTALLLKPAHNGEFTDPTQGGITPPAVRGAKPREQQKSLGSAGPCRPGVLACV